MRDLSGDTGWLSINTATVRNWSLAEVIEGCARAGITAISPWRDKVQECGLIHAAALCRRHGMTVTGLCRGGMFPAADAAGLIADPDRAALRMRAVLATRGVEA